MLRALGRFPFLIVMLLVVVLSGCVSTRSGRSKVRAQAVQRRPVAKASFSSELPAPAPGRDVAGPADPPPVLSKGSAPGRHGEEGLASYYSDRLRGARTASGARYDPRKATCAHRSLPFGTVLRVTTVETGKTATCRVNDRGPWISGRVVDVSKVVAVRLGLIGRGLVRVRVLKAESGAPH